MNPLLPLATTLMTGAGSMAPGRPPSPRKAEAFFMSPLGLHIDRQSKKACFLLLNCI